MFKTGVVLVLISEASGKTLRITEDGNVDGKGEEEENGNYHKGCQNQRHNLV